VKYARVAAERAFFKVLATWIRIDWLQGLHCILMTMFPIRLGSDAEFRTLREARPTTGAVLLFRWWTRAGAEWLKRLEPDERKVLGEDI
jgi:hypothetical protein